MIVAHNSIIPARSLSVDRTLTRRARERVAAKNVRRKPPQRTSRLNRVDPSRTKTLRDAFTREMRVRWDRVARLIAEAVDELDVFGLRDEHPLRDTLRGNVGGPGSGNWGHSGAPGIGGSGETGGGVGEVGRESLVGDKGDVISNEGGYIDIQYKDTKFAPRSQSIVDFVVDEDKRGRGYGKQLVQQALSEYEDLGGQASSKASVSVLYDAGFRNPSDPSLSKQDLFSVVDENTSVYMAVRDPDGALYVPKPKINSTLRTHARRLAAKEFAFTLSHQKMEGFIAWVEEVMRDELQLVSGAEWPEHFTISDHWVGKYVKSGYKQGMSRSVTELRKAGLLPELPPTFTPRFIDAAFQAPVHAERVGLIFSRAYEELRAVSQEASGRMSQILAQGMAEGRHPRLLGRQLEQVVRPIKVRGSRRWLSAKQRGEMIARTETIRAHHHAMVNTYKEAGVTLGRIMAEWKATPDGRVCDQCEGMDGRIFELDKTLDLIPAHPNCRCALLPAMIGETLLGD